MNKITLSFPADWIIEIEMRIRTDQDLAQVPILIPGAELNIDVTGLMTREQCEKFCERLTSKVTQISIKQMQTDFFTRGKQND